MTNILTKPIIDQANSEQPNIFIVLIVFLVPGSLLTLCTKGLMLTNAFDELCSNHPLCYSAIFFCIQIALIVIAVLFFCRRYSEALFTKRTDVPKRRIAKASLIIFPLAIWYIHNIWGFIVSANGMLRTGTSIELSEAFTSMYQTVWGTLAYDASSIGVIFSSLLSLIVPLHEEIMINGFIANWMIRRTNFIFSLILMPIVFVFAHVPALGFGNHLWGLFFAGLSYILIRVATGSIAWAIVFHCFINILIFIPKWAIVILYNVYAFQGK